MLRIETYFLFLRTILGITKKRDMSVNKVILIGNVGKDPDIRYFEANKGVANFTLATTERAHKGWNDQMIPERTEWHNIVVRGGLVQVVEKYVHKGTKLYIEGKIRSRTYVDRENQTRFVTEIAVDTLEILSRREPSAGSGDQHGTASAHDDQDSYGGLGEPNDDDAEKDILASDFNIPF